MSVTRCKNSRSLAFFVALAAILTLAVPFAAPAVAQVTGDNEFGLEVQPEIDTNPTGTRHTLTATIYSKTPAGSSTNISTCTRAGDCQVDFEVETGPAVIVRLDQGTADRTTDADNSPTTPDMTCTITQGGASCSVVFTSNTVGDNQIRAWIDDDKNNSTLDFDTTEGRYAGAGDCVTGGFGAGAAAGAEADPTSGCTSTTVEPGVRDERDDTDVVRKSWFSAATNIVLDCDDATTSNETQGGGATADDTETNAPGASETYTCRAWDTKGTTSTTDDTNPSGIVIDAEHAGANDPDNSGLGTASTADYNNACTTGGDGTCTFSLAASENETGVATVCFWIDEDADTEFNGSSGSRADGGECGEGVSADEGTATVRPTNVTDVVQKTWATPAASALDAEPERDSNLKGTSHTTTATVTDQFGNPSANTPVDFHIVSGANVALGNICNQVLTNSTGVATCTYTDSTTIVGPEPERDEIVACVDAAAPQGTTTTQCDDTLDAAVDEANQTEFTNLNDRVEKFWFTTFPTAAAVIVDMNSTNGCTQAADSTATNAVETNHTVCGLVTNATNQPVAGKNVNLTLSGPGFFTRGGGTTTRADDPNLGQSITVTTDQNGIYTATITSIATGTTTVTATADSATDTGTKTWTALAAGARTVDCEPETGTNPPGSSHVITCTARDRLGNPVTGELINVTESGPGRISSPTNGNCTGGANTFVGQACLTTAANGQAEVVVSSTTNETGTQTITAALEQDDDDSTPLTRDATEQQDECDRVAGDPAVVGQSPAGPAGVCADEVTKTWGEAPPEPECSDGIDNDGDGEIDFPDDRGCTSADDDDETGPFIPRACRNRGATENVIVGTSGADVLNGTSGRDIICGAGGDDIISGRGGNDLITGNGGNDTIAGGGGKDNISGNAGDDSISGGRGNDAIKGNGGNDAIKGNNGIDNLTGGRGSDTLQGGDKQDILRGGAGNDTLRGGKGDDALDGGPGNDQCFGNAGDDDIKNCE